MHSNTVTTSALVVPVLPLEVPIGRSLTFYNLVIHFVVMDITLS